MNELSEKFWKKWLEADELEKVDMLKKAPVFAELSEVEGHAQVTLLNSYLMDLANYLAKKKGA